MSNFEKFREQFEKDYRDLNDFGEKVDYDLSCLPYNATVVQSNHEDYDSYGRGLENIKTIIYFGDFDVYVQFESHRQSFNGIIWDNYKEVKLTTKTIQIYE